MALCNSSAANNGKVNHAWLAIAAIARWVDLALAAHGATTAASLPYVSQGLRTARANARPNTVEHQGKVAWISAAAIAN